MPAYKLTHPGLDGQTHYLAVRDGNEISPEYERAGWTVEEIDEIPIEFDDEDEPADEPEVEPDIEPEPTHPEQADTSLDLTEE